VSWSTVWLPRRQVTSCPPGPNEALAPRPPSAVPSRSCTAVSPWKRPCVCSQASHVAGPTLTTFFCLGGGTAPLQPEALAPTPAPPAHRLLLPICPPRKSRPWDHFLRRHLDCLFSGPSLPQRRGSDPSPFPHVPHPCLPRWVSLDRPTLPCPCSRKGLSAPVDLVSLPGMLLPDACHPVALGVLGTLECSVGACV